MTLVLQFYATDSGNWPVREWLRSLTEADRKRIGARILAVQSEWPVGMPTVRKLQTRLWELRVSVASGEARILFTIQGNTLVILHGFMKKTQKTPPQDIELARQRLRSLKEIRQ